ncbi:DUF4249 family protein [Pontibacter mangrovi]|uniref:DUF4249 domain-containing protein n=1 Tax=Pontibacter mangrovi TaxID=2589816 RepID=A0A501W378_9BACT|nr:DUF4249 family protein [Pontibacter mangrovi]TPE43738.1 DUF4249 domain-containing protein [Pontibacter mangrovi]
MEKYNRMKYRLLCGLLCLLLVGCEMVQEVDIPPHTPKLTMRFTLDDSGETPAGFYDEDRVFIGRSQGVLDGKELEAVANATVGLYDEEGQLVEQYEHIGVDTMSWYRPDWGIYTPTQGYRPHSGHTYTLRAEAPGFEAIEATTTLPAAATATDARFTKSESSGEDYYMGMLEGHLQLTIHDEVGKENYYKVMVYALDSAYHQTGYSATTIRDDNVIDIGDSEKAALNMVFSDELYPSGIINFATDLSLPDKGYNQKGELVPVKHLEVQVHQLNRDEYLFQKTRAAQSRMGDNPFAEYSNVYSNVKNGYGALGGLTVTRVVLDL